VSDYTILRADEAPDYSGDAPGGFLGYGRPLGATQLAVNMRVLPPNTASVPPGEDPTKGHSHKTIEEIYLVVKGEVTVKLGDDVATLREHDAVLVPPETTRSFRNDTESEAAVLMMSVRVQDQSTESEWHDSFWL